MTSAQAVNGSFQVDPGIEDTLKRAASAELQIEEHDRDKLAAEDIRMQSKDESKVAENTDEP